jgi:hypothetical protein
VVSTDSREPTTIRLGVWRHRYVVEWRAGRDERLTLDAGVELADDAVEVRGGPAVQVREADGFALLAVGDEIDDAGVASRCAESVMYFWSTSTSLKSRHLAP